MPVDVLAREMGAGKVPVDAYQMAVAGGYTGTKEQFQTDMGNSGTNATNAANAATAAAAAAITAANAAANLAKTYSSSSIYSVGDYVLYNGGLYKCNTSITSPETWTAAHWTSVKVGTELTGINNILDSTIYEIVSPNLLNFDDPNFTPGKYVNPSSGALLPPSADSDYSTSGFIPVEAGATYTYTYGNVVGAGKDLRFVGAYDAEKECIPSAGQSASTPTYTVPEGVSYIRISAKSEYFKKTTENIMFYKGTSIDNYYVYYDRYVINGDALNGPLGYITPEMYGAKGNGTDDDTQAIKKALNSGFPVLFSQKTYCVSESITSTANIIVGNHTVIKIIGDFSSNNVLRFSDNLILSGIVFDSNGNNINGFVMVNAQNNVNPVDVEMSNIIIDGVQDTNSTTLTSLLNIYYCRNISVHDISISNCTKLSDGAPASGGGGLTGIRVQYLQGAFRADKLYIKNCYNIDSGGNIVIDDADGVFCLATSEYSNCAIENSVFYNAGKRAIKTQCINPVSVTNNYIYNDIPSLVNLIGIQSVDELNIPGDGYVESCTIVDAAATGTGGSGIAIFGNGKISNCILKFSEGTNNKGVLVGAETTVENCTLYGNCFGTIGTSKNLNIFDSKIILDKNGGISYSNTSNESVITVQGTTFKNISTNTFVQGADIGTGTHLIMSDCTINCKMTLSTKTALIKDCVYLVDNDGYSYNNSFVLNGNGDYKFYNIKFLIVSSTQSGRTFIRVSSGNSPKIELENVDGITTYAQIVYLYGAATLNIKRGVPLNKLNISAAASVTNTPDWVDSLPSTTALKDNIFCLYKIDGKLYKISSGSWVAV